MHLGKRKVNGGNVECLPADPQDRGGAFNGHANGSGNADIDRDLGLASGKDIRTYKRRKKLRLSSERRLQDGLISSEAAGQLADEIIMDPQEIVLYHNSYDQEGVPGIHCPVLLQGSDDCPREHWRNVVLKHISESLDVGEGGVQSCIQDALASSRFGFNVMFKTNGESEQTVDAQESVHYHNLREKRHPQFQRKPNKVGRSRSAARKRKTNASRASADKANDKGNAQVTTALFQRVFFDVIVSKKFSLLCKLLCESFPGFRGDNLLDFSVINSRMIKGDYEQSPICYARDIQEVWRKLQKIGSEIVSLTKSLSDMSWTSYHNKVEGLVNGTCEEEKDEGINEIHLGKKGGSNLVNGTRFPSQESDRYTKPEHTEGFGINKVCTCSHCGEKADGKDCLVCDSCEEIYHVFCIVPPVEEIPPTNWFCANCSLSGIESPHENCVVCEKLNDPIILTREEEMVLVGVDMCSDGALEEWSDCSMKNKDTLPNGNCKVCGIGEENGQKFRICGHSMCPNKFYHIRCLTREQLKSHGPLWYCPSCLCRACLTDKDDDEIVLCDGCDHAYHIYCMRPPQTSIPSGKWFCGGCEVDIEAICEAREKHENGEKQTMDMLISAAEKLKSEEKSVGAGMKKR